MVQIKLKRYTSNLSCILLCHSNLSRCAFVGNKPAISYFIRQHCAHSVLKTADEGLNQDEANIKSTHVWLVGTQCNGLMAVILYHIMQ